MNIGTLIISPLSGAVIGYFTNWLAVKMLFRPYREKRLFGLKLPFTPGLIPKEKAILAQKIGNTLTKNILTEDELKKAVSTPEVLDKLTSILDGFLNGLTTGAYDNQIGELSLFLADKLEGLVNNPDGPAVNVIRSLYGNLRDRVVSAGTDYLRSDRFIELLSRIITTSLDKLTSGGKTVGDFVPDRLVAWARLYLTDKAPEIVSFIKALPEKYPELDERLGTLVAKVAEDNFGALLGVFIHYDKLYEKIKTSLFKYLDAPENQVYMTGKAINAIDGVLAKSAGNLAAKIPESAKDDIIAGLAALVRDGLDNGGLDNVITAVDMKVENLNLGSALARLTPDVKSFFNRIIERLIKGAVGSINEDNAHTLREFAIKALKVVVEKGGAYVVSSMAFDKLVESKINDFSVEETEELVVSVVEKELKAITKLGGVLGFIIGFVPAILNILGIS